MPRVVTKLSGSSMIRALVGLVAVGVLYLFTRKRSTRSSSALTVDETYIQRMQYASKLNMKPEDAEKLSLATLEYMVKSNEAAHEQRPTLS
jgi:hypothetical protein